MSDRFKFRAKRLDNNKFVYGYLCFIYVDNEKHCKIYSPDDAMSYDCYTETLGQCTGLKDRNQKLIYEGDVLDFDLSTPKNGGHYRGFIRWQKQNELIGWMISDMDMSGDWDLRQIAHPNDWMVWGEIIGNIHENADLLENEDANSRTNKY